MAHYSPRSAISSDASKYVYEFESGLGFDGSWYEAFFDTAFSEFCFDLFAGTACMLILPGSVTQPLVFKAIPLKDYCIEEGPNGEVFAVYRHYSLQNLSVKRIISSELVAGEPHTLTASSAVS